MGSYEQTFNLNQDGGFISYQLEIFDNGRYYFQYSRQMSKDLKVKHSYSQGNWSIDAKGRLELQMKPEDFNEKFKLNLSGSKAHYRSKSPRDKSDREIPTTLKFYSSEVPWFKGVPLLKK